MRRILGRVLLVVLAACTIAALLLVRLDIPVSELAGRYTSPASRFVTVDGLRVHYRDEGQGPVVVLLHGGASSLHTWEAWTQVLRQDLRVVRLDLPGHGLTGPSPAGDYTVVALAGFLDHFVAEVGLTRFHLAGNSMGGAVAWNYALEHPDKVDKLILIDAAGFPQDNPRGLVRLARLPGVNRMFLYVTPRWLVEQQVRFMYADDTKITDELVQRHYELVRREGNRRAVLARWSSTELYRVEALGRIQSPTLIQWGAQDTVFPLSHAQRFDELIPNSQLTVYRGVGHIPMEESPAETVADARRFLLSR